MKLKNSKKKKKGIKLKKKEKVLKSYVKENIMQITKKNKVQFILAEFSACPLGFPSGYDSGVIWSWCKPMPGAVPV